MRIKLAEQLEDWMLPSKERVTGTQEIALASILHKVICEHDYESGYSIDEVMGNCGIFQDGKLYGIEDNIICSINHKMHYFRECYISRDGHLILVVKKYQELNDPNDHTPIWESEKIYYVAEGM